MEAHDIFERWAVGQGVVINSIKAHKFEGRGLGIIAEKDFKTGETLLNVPLSALHHASSVPRALKVDLPNITVHGLLAADLLLNAFDIQESWATVLPTFSDFATMPILWHPKLQAHLPSAAKKLLSAQETKFASDWAIMSAVYPEISYEAYLYKWLIVNTRTFYYVSPRVSNRAIANIAREDRMTLNPFADYFNHSSVGCDVAFSPGGYTVTTPKPIQKGEEIYISYGHHSNDFLIVEYGFMLEDNLWDEIVLDECILPMLNEQQKESLEHSGFLGNYVLDKETVCYRTQVALRILCVTPRKWQRFVDGLDTGENDQAKVDIKLNELLKVYKEDVSQTLARLEKLALADCAQKGLLVRRWKQIEALLSNHIPNGTDN